MGLTDAMFGNEITWGSLTEGLGMLVYYFQKK